MEYFDKSNFESEGFVLYDVLDEMSTIPVGI